MKQIPFEDAIAYVRLTKRASVADLQQHFNTTFGIALHAIEEMERAGIVSAPMANGKRTVRKIKKTYTPEQILASG